MHESGQRVPNPTILPNFPLLDSNSKAALGSTHIKAKRSTRDEVPPSQLRSHMLTLPLVGDIRDNLKGKEMVESRVKDNLLNPSRHPSAKEETKN